MVEIYDEDTLTEFELNRQRNIIKNFEFMKACGLPVKPLIYVKRVHVPLEEQFKYLSDESSDSSDEEWTLGPKKKKKEKNEPKSADIRIKVSNPTEFFKQKKKREEEEKNGNKDVGESSKAQETKKRKRKSKNKKKEVVDDARPSTSGTSILSKPSTSGILTSSNQSKSGRSKSGSSSAASSSVTSEATFTTKPTSTNDASQAVGIEDGASTVKVSVGKEKANGKHFIKERPKLPASTLKRKNIDSSSDEDDDTGEDHNTLDIPVVPETPFQVDGGEDCSDDYGMRKDDKNGDDCKKCEVPVELSKARYPKREGKPRVNYSEAEIPDDDHYIFCAECNLYYQGECSKHLPIQPISDSTTSDGSLKARSSLPEGMEIKKSGIKDAGLGVFSTMAFKSGATFGPYAGEKVRADVPKVGLDTSYMWEIVKDLKVVYYINGKNEQHANWMRYVNCSRNEEEQNMIAYQFHGKIFYRVYKDVEAGTEFLVWYGEEYAGELGIALEEKPESVKPGNFLTFKCDWCLICYAFEEALTKHKKYCSKKPKKTSGFVDGEVQDQPASGSAGSSKKKKVHECPVCGKFIIGSTSNLEYHLRVHTGDKPFSCQQCGKKFSQQCNLTTHMRTHTQEQPFMCEVCGYQCNHASALREHIRVHSGERPFKCVVCGKGFTQASQLKGHSRTHTGETPYKCVVCGKRFKQLNALQYHSRTHTGEKPYQCPHCEYKCNRKSSLNRHVKSQHRS